MWLIGQPLKLTNLACLRRTTTNTAIIKTTAKSKNNNENVFDVFEMPLPPPTIITKTKNISNEQKQHWHMKEPQPVKSQTTTTTTTTTTNERTTLSLISLILNLWSWHVWDIQGASPHQPGLDFHRAPFAQAHTRPWNNLKQNRLFLIFF